MATTDMFYSCKFVTKQTKINNYWASLASYEILVQLSNGAISSGLCFLPVKSKLLTDISIVKSNK